MKRIVILGGGTGGTLLANRLRRAYRPEAAEIVVVDRDDAHVYQPGRCSSTSTTTPSRWAGITPARSASRCCGRPA
jgi:NADH dehydrogenase FAD-containing subunit